MSRMNLKQRITATINELDTLTGDMAAFSFLPTDIGLDDNVEVGQPEWVPYNVCEQIFCFGDQPNVSLKVSLVFIY
ncbi:hypothetical protein TNCV_1094071 [Trichonephila clavipes]|uniref:Uncharacterized protein n=1 Tax=Trichonephila clavipes TaxID=2585209 RepID=A0A8X6V383_TRICX|nr:hypothetical protein TNCV_1094071 [Trichonephila clavipes]